MHFFTKSNILILFMLCAGVVSIGYTYHRYMIRRDFLVHIKVDCNPMSESCFAAPCEAEDNNGCVKTDEGDFVVYYKYILKKAYLFPDCDPQSSDCMYPTCEGDESCVDIVCNDETIEEGTYCTQ